MSTGGGQCRRGKVAPLLPLALAVAVGIVADRYASPWGTRAWGALAIAGAVAGGGFGRRPSVSVVGVLLAFAGLGGGWHHQRWSDLAADDLARGMPESPMPAWVRGALGDVLILRPKGDEEEAASRGVLEISAIHDGRRWRGASGRVQLLILGGREDLEAGEAIEAAGMLSRVAGPLNPGEFDYRGFLRAQGIRLRLTVDQPDGIRRDLGRPPWPWTRRLGRIRAWSHSRLTAELDHRLAPLAAALLLGRREGVDPDLNDAFARTGTTHLLAISGLHMQVLAGVLWMLFRAVGLGRRGAFAAVGLATVSYAVLVGLMPSVVRSAAMTVTVCLAGICDRRARPANVLALASLVTLALNPSHLFDIGCQLSFLAIAAIVWGVGPATDLLRYAYYAVTFRHQGPAGALDTLERSLEPWWVRRMRRWPVVATSGMVVSLVVWLAALPLVAFRFHLVAQVGILLNLPLIPLTSAALLAAGLTLALASLSARLARLPARFCNLGLVGTEALVRWGASRPWGHAFVAGPSWDWVLAWYGLLALAVVLGVGRRPGRRWAWGAWVAWNAIGAVAVLRPGRHEALEVEVLAVGHGLAVVIQSAGGRTIVYDCGRMRDPKVGRRIIAPALWERGVRHIDALILSHADADHFNGLPDLLDRFSIAEVRVAPGFGSEANPAAVRLLEAVRARGVALSPIAAGMRWERPGTRFAAWHPPRDQGGLTTDNARSVVLDVESMGRHLLLTGDLEREGLTRLVSRPRPRLDAFLSPHHGGATANPPWLYDWACPALVLASQRPPAAGTRDALVALGARRLPVLRTWERGAIRLRWTADGLIASGFLDPPKGGAGGWGVVPERGWGRGMVGWLTGSALVWGTLGFAAGLLACGVMLVTEWGAWAMVLPGRRLGGASVDAVADLGEEIEAIAPDGIRLAGVWNPAAGESQGWTVLLIHGFAESRPAFRERVAFLTARGWNVACLDMRGSGRSGGDRVSFGGREAGDVRAWIDVVSARVGPSLRVAVWGRSMGAAIASRAAAEDPRIACLVLESPYDDLLPVLACWLRRVRVPWPSGFARLIANRAARLAGVSLTHPRPLDLAPRVRASALVVHGRDDRLVEASAARRLALAFPRAEGAVEVAGAGHGNVIEVGGVDLLERIAAFLEATCHQPV